MCFRGVSVSIAVPRRRVAVLDKLTDFLLFLGKILITGSVGKSAALLGSKSQTVFGNN